MTKYETRQVTTISPEATEQIGERIGQRLHGGEVIELVSDLGGGKTTLVRGIARGMGSSSRVASPTFTLSREYHADHKTLHHFDFYRLHEAGIVADELAEVIHEPKAAVVVEWGDIVSDVLPAERLTITIQTTGETERQLRLTYPARLAYLVEAVS